MKTLKNKYLTIGVKSLGAELSSIKSNETGWEYLWQADPAFWKRHSPVLFPIVGSVWNGEFRCDGKLYKMSQHGFARNSEFELLSETENEVFYILKSNTETLEKYPFPFELTIGYRLVDKKVEVIWKVKNIGDSTMHFQIGAHPAFNYKIVDTNANERGYITFDEIENLNYNTISEKACVTPDLQIPLHLDKDGLLAIPNEQLENTYILENAQVRCVALLDNSKKPYITVCFDAPVVALWSPSQNAPFMCIEPWYGRCDRVGHEGEFKNRDWVNSLEANEVFETSYTITIKEF